MSIINTIDSQINGVIVNNKYNNSYLDDSKSFQANRLNCMERNNYSFKVILIGDSSVGKTSIISQYIQGTFKTGTQTTVCTEMRKKTIAMDLSTTAELTIWDTCGEERYKSVTKSQYHNSNGVILVYDINDKKTFMNLSEWHHDVCANTDKYAFIILVGNKVDLERKVNLKDVEQFATEKQIPFFEISAKTGINVQLIFEDLLKGMFVRMKEKEGDERENNQGGNVIQNQSQKLAEGKAKDKTKKMDRGGDVGCC